MPRTTSSIPRGPARRVERTVGGPLSSLTGRRFAGVTGYNSRTEPMPETAAIEIPNRALFKAAEVCDIVKVQPYVLRSWEAEFPALGVSKAAGGPRVYRRADVEQVVTNQAPAACRRPDARRRAPEARRGRDAGRGGRGHDRRADGQERARAAHGGQARAAVDSRPAGRQARRRRVRACRVSGASPSRSPVRAAKVVKKAAPTRAAKRRR